MVEEIYEQDYTQRFKPAFEHEDRDPTRQPLSPGAQSGFGHQAAYAVLDLHR